MASNLLVSLDEFQRRIDAVNENWSQAEAESAERIIEGVSRKLEDICGRIFYSTGAATTRYFTAEAGNYLVVPDLISIDTDGLTTDEDGDRTYERTWATTDYDLWPYNASEFTEPYTELRTTPKGNYAFPTISKGVKIVGNWGWSTTPPEIVEAVFLEASRIWQAAQSPSGVHESAELGQWIIQPQMHPATVQLIAGYRRNLAR